MTGQAPAYDLREEAAHAYRLRDLLSHVKAVINGAFRQYYWIVAEVSSVSRSSAGHYYFELADPGEDGNPVAAVRGNLWAGVARRVVPEFTRTTGQTFRKGMELMLQVKVEMNILYGFSLTITDINPDYTLGNLERRREAAIKKLREDGVFDLNKQLPLPSLLLRIAVISSETAAGYGDFMTTVRQSGLEEFFSIKLFPAAMQGNSTTQTVNVAFSKIYFYRKDFDAVFIMRGGGSKQDLAAFDDYDLCTTIANFPLPVLTAIGHEQDTSIADMVAHTRFKTPTALGEFLIARFTEQLAWILSSRRRLDALLDERLKGMKMRNALLLSRTQGLLSDLEKTNNRRLQSLRQRTQKVVTGRFSASAAAISLLRQGIRTALSNGLERDRARLSHLRVRLPGAVKKTALEIQSKNALLAGRLHRFLNDRRSAGHSALSRLSAALSRSLSVRQTAESSRLPALTHRLTRILLASGERDKTRLDSLARRAALLDPSRIMARGFIVAVNSQGNPVTGLSDIREGEEITLNLLDGRAAAEIKKTIPNS